jgi:pyruvate dehydrogenase E2 component (dihydrolipoamide acetyltransferase)
MPAPAAGVEEATLLEWSVDDHAAFALSDVLLVIETDKAVIDVEAETAGVLHRKLVGAGRSVPVGTPLAVIGEAGDSEAEIEALAAEAGADGAPAAAATSEPAPADAAGSPSGGKHGYDAAAVPAPSATPGAPGPAAAAASSAPAAPASAAPAPAAAPSDTGGRIFASPIARQMAKSAGLTLDELSGTGPGGRIVRWDVEQAVAQRQQSASAAPAAAAAPAGAGRASAGERGFTDEPHSKLRSAIASRLTFSKQNVPHFYVRATPRVDALLALRKELNAGGGQKISVNDLVVRAVARAHRLLPAANAIFLDSATRHFDFVDVAVAVATDGGLVTPVLRDVDRTSISEIAASTRDFAERARSGRLRQHELEGGSITVTNLGMFGTESFSAIINPPHSAILAVGAARPEPVAVEGENGLELAAATVMHLELSVDHRVLDGVVAAQWMGVLTDLLEHPVRILA